ncbi:MAG: tRNA modification GTPase [Flavobacteriales bacterium]|jgi:tRNA modification GTPase
MSKFLSQTEDIICAISSPPGVGAIALVRLSGKGSIELFNTVFNKNITEAKGYTVHFGEVLKNKATLDEVVVTIFRNPQSFTGEDTLEIACHGSKYIQQELLQLLIEKGARMALAGEFSKRAFYNGKLDLAQTESIADLIHSESEGAHRLAMQQMKGGISKELQVLRSKLIHFASLIELELDFSEEDVEFANRTALINLVTEVLKVLHQLLTSFQMGNAIKNGVNVAIVGKPNAGKSSWINALTDDEVAIVSNIPGTTRDKIEVPITIEGIEFRLIDTAGLRETDDIIEGIGVRKAKEVIGKAAIIIYMIEISELSHEAIEEQMKDISELNDEASSLILINKADTIENGWTDLAKAYSHISNLKFVAANSEESIQTVKTELVDIIKKSSITQNDVIISNARHFEALKNAEMDLLKVSEGLKTSMSGDFLAMDIRQALYHLGTITGEVSTDDLLGNIFANFCIGK